MNLSLPKNKVVFFLSNLTIFSKAEIRGLKLKCLEGIDRKFTEKRGQWGLPVGVALRT